MLGKCVSVAVGPFEIPAGSCGGSSTFEFSEVESVTWTVWFHWQCSVHIDALLSREVWSLLDSVCLEVIEGMNSVDGDSLLAIWSVAELAHASH